jgi:hypothetical protein
MKGKSLVALACLVAGNMGMADELDVQPPLTQGSRPRMRITSRI